MRNHVFTTFGLVMLGIFLWRLTNALAEPGFGLAELYILGGFVLSLVLIITGIRGLLADRRAKKNAAPGAPEGPA